MEEEKVLKLRTWSELSTKRKVAVIMLLILLAGFVGYLVGYYYALDLAQQHYMPLIEDLKKRCIAFW